MICIECKELVYKRITYKNIFKVKTEAICDNCFSKYIFIQELEVIPINDGSLYLNVLFNKSGDPLGFMSFLKPYYLYYLKQKLDMTILYFDSFDNLVYNVLQNISLGNIYIIVLNNDLKKENDYEDRSNW